MIFQVHCRVFSVLFLMFLVQFYKKFYRLNCNHNYFCSYLLWFYFRVLFLKFARKETVKKIVKAYLVSGNFPGGNFIVVECSTGWLYLIIKCFTTWRIACNIGWGGVRIIIKFLEFAVEDIFGKIIVCNYLAFHYYSLNLAYDDPFR